MEKSPSYFITIEGVEGVGKSTGLECMRRYLDMKNVPYLVTREPGGTPCAEAIRGVLLNHYEEAILPETEVLLMFGARAQHIANVIKPALESGLWVLCDRFTDASYAYQGAGRGIGNERIQQLEQWIQKDLQPDLTILLDAPVEVALRRARRRNKLDRFETQSMEFFKKTREGYLDRVKQNPARYQVVQANRPHYLIKRELCGILQKLIKGPITTPVIQTPELGS